jgi:membrane dipeptidase
MSTARTVVPIFDGHNDTLLKLLEGKRSFFERSDFDAIDLPRAREGGLGGGFCAISVPSDMRIHAGAVSPADRARRIVAAFGGDAIPPTPTLEHARDVALRMMALLSRIERQSKGRLRIVTSAAEIESCLDRGIFAALMHLEGAEAIDPELNSLEVFYRAGLRSLAPVWSRPNAFGYGVPFRFPHSPDTGPGLTDAGKALVRVCNEMHLVFDLSHLNEQGFWDVARLTHAPLVATHSGAHALSPSTRNLTDKQLAAIKESQGLVGLNFHVGFLRPDGEIDTNTSLDVVVDHIDHLVEDLGIDGVGFGSDLEYAAVPDELEDASLLQNLITALRRRGYDDASIGKLAHGNWIRVLRTTWGR